MAEEEFVLWIIPTFAIKSLFISFISHQKNGPFRWKCGAVEKRVRRKFFTLFKITQSVEWRTLMNIFIHFELWSCVITVWIWTHLTPKLPLYRHQSTNLQSKSIDWFLLMATFAFNELKRFSKDVIKKLTNDCFN